MVTDPDDVAGTISELARLTVRQHDISSGAAAGDRAALLAEHRANADRIRELDAALHSTRK